MSKEKYARLLVDTLEMPFEEWLMIASRHDNIEVEGDELEWMVYGYLSDKDYAAQLLQPDKFWRVPGTSFTGDFDDDYFENQFSI